jgi:hypothetical protein
MQRCAQGLSLVIIILTSCAYILDDMALLLAAGTLLAALLGQYLLFDYRFRGIVTSVAVQRSLERSQVRKGTTLRVATTVTLTIPPAMHAQITERLSPQVVVQDGDTTLLVEPDHAGGSREDAVLWDHRLGTKCLLLSCDRPFC